MYFYYFFQVELLIFLCIVMVKGCFLPTCKLLSEYLFCFCAVKTSFETYWLFLSQISKSTWLLPELHCPCSLDRPFVYREKIKCCSLKVLGVLFLNFPPHTLKLLKSNYSAVFIKRYVLHQVVLLLRWNKIFTQSNIQEDLDFKWPHHFI